MGTTSSPHAAVGREVFRSTGQAASGILGALLFGGICFSQIFRYDDTLALALWGTLGLLICFFMVRIALAHVRVTRQGIRVRNVLNNCELDWGQIDHFDIGRSGMLGEVCRIHLKDGGMARAFGIQETHWSAAGRKHPAVEIADELNLGLQAAKKG